MEQSLIELLNDKKWYSFSTKYVCKKLGCTHKKLVVLAEKCKINVFKFKDVEYIGLESRRLDYERDKKNGTNHVEKLIKSGYY